jgi:glutamine synthetase
LYGIKNKLQLGEPFAGNGYEDANVGRVPWNLPDAIELWRNSAIARECFGDNVHHWILRSAESEWEAFNRTVTDWEKNRYFERI